MKSTKPRRILLIALATLLTVGLATTDAEAKKKKKNKKKDKKPKAEVVQKAPAKPEGLVAMPGAVREADRLLMAYDTDAANRALDDNDATADAWVGTARGRVLAQERKYDAAADRLREAADLDTRNPAPALFLGDTYAYSGKKGSADDAYAQAEARARGLLETNADNPEALYYLGLAEQRQRRFADAVATLEKARSLRPDDPSILFELGVTRFHQEQFQAASDLLSAALKKNSSIAYAYYYRGLAASKLQRKDLLFNDLDQFVKMAPEAPEAVTARQVLDSFG